MIIIDRTRRFCGAAAVLALGLCALACAPETARAQSSILQGGPITAGHAPMYLGAGTQPMVQDSGPAGGGDLGLGLSEQLQVNRGAAGTGTGPLGSHVCSYDAPITNASGYHYLCLDANAQGGGLIAYGAGGGAGPLSLNINVNGTVVPLGGVTTQIIVGTTSVQSGTSGRVLYDNAGTLGEYTGAQLTALINPATASLPGTLPAFPNTTTTYFRGDGTYATHNCASLSNAGALCSSTDAANLTGTVASARLAGAYNGITSAGLTIGSSPIASGTTTRVLYDNAGVIGEYTATQLTALINAATSSLSGALPAFPNNTTTYFRGDGTYVTHNCASLTNSSTMCSSTDAANLTGTLAAARLPAFGSGDVSFASGGGAGTIAANAVTLAKLATQATNTILGNATSGTAVPTALAIGSCSGASNALIWTTNSGFGCNSITAGSAAANALTGTTMAANVVNSSLTSVGTLAGLTVTSSFTATGLVANASLANMSAGTVKCNDTGGATAPADCSHIAFYVHKNGTNQTGMLTSAYDRVTWSTAKFNNGGGTFSGNRWTAPVAGYIVMNATAFYTANLANNGTENLTLKIIKNSAGTCNGTDALAGPGAPWSGLNFGAAQANGIDLAAAGDVYEVCSFAVSSNAANDIQIDGNQAHTHWSGGYIR